MGNSATTLPYDIGEQQEYSGNSHWHLCKGLRKDDKDEVSIFRFLKSQTDKQIPAQRCFQKLRTIKHPYVLSYIDGIDLEDSLVLVTESCVSLELWIRDTIARITSDDERQAILQESMWGFKCVLNALGFFHSTCNVSHNYLGHHAIFVCKNGDWKIGALDLASNLSLADDCSFLKSYVHLLGPTFIAPERKQFSLTEAQQSNLQGAADIFSLAQAMNQLFSAISVTVPTSVSKLVAKMQLSDPRKRPSAEFLLKHPDFNTEHILLLSNLGELAIKPTGESISILGNITSQVSLIPRPVCIHKILPSVARVLQMAVNDFSNRDSRETCRQAVQKAVQLLSDLAQLNKIDEASFVAKCLPVVIHLWGMSDRAVRTSLLKSLKNLVTFIPSSAVNKNIFEPLLAGFSDSNAKMREETLKSLVHVVEKLDERQLQDQLVRCVTSLQGDAEPSIRTNATIFLGRIAPKLKEGVRARVLCPSFVKAMRDNFVHCRVAGLRAALACLAMMDVNSLTGKLMPQICLLLLDKAAEVRDLSLQLLESSTVILKSHHSILLAQEKKVIDSGSRQSQSGPNQETVTKPPNSSGGTWTSWAVEGLSKSLEKVAVGSVNEDSQVASENFSQTTLDARTDGYRDQSSIQPSKPQPIKSDDSVDVNRWEDDFDFEDDQPVQVKKSSTQVDADGWDDDFDIEDDGEAVKGQGWGNSSEDVHLSPSLPTFKKTSSNISSTAPIGLPNQTSKAISGEWGDDFGDGFDDDAFSSVPLKVVAQPSAENFMKSESKAEKIITEKSKKSDNSAEKQKTLKSGSKKVAVTKLSLDSSENWDDF